MHILLPAFLLFFVHLNATPKIDIVFPISGQVLKENKYHFIYGNVQPPEAKFKINGKSVGLYKNGAFMAYLPVQKGEFIFSCIAVTNNDTVIFKLPVYVDFTPEIPTDTLMIDYDSITPQQPLVLISGDELKLSMRATPRSKVFFKIDGTNNWFFLMAEKKHPDYYSGKLFLTDNIEKSAINGHIGSYEIDAANPIKNRSIKVRVEGSNGDIISHSFGDITIHLSSLSRFIRLQDEMTRVHTESKNPGDLFLPSGTILKVTGKKAHFWRIALGEKTGWVKDGPFNWLAEDNKTLVAVCSQIKIEELVDMTRIRVPLSYRAPYKVEQTRSQSKIYLNIWDTKASENLSLIDSSNFIKRVTWKNETNRKLRINIQLDLKQQWGYFAYYEGNDLLLDIKHPPKAKSAKSSLFGRSIMLDAGHHPDEGAIGPSRLEERKVNWQITKILKNLLEQEGANVFLTRNSEQGMLINGRLQKIKLIQPDVVISIHNNSLPEGFDPYRRRGTATFYYHLQSYPLAKMVQNNLVRDLKLPSQGVRFADLAICRPSGMPIILVEAAFMVLPKQEYLLGTEKFQNKIATSLFRSLKQFFKENQLVD